MTMITVDDLARDLKVRNEDLVKQLVTMGFEVEGPESPLETDDPAALREELVTALPQREVIEKRINRSVIRRRVKKKPQKQAPEKQEPKMEAARTATEAAGDRAAQPVSEHPARTEKKTGEAGKPAPKKMKKPEPAKIIEKAPEPPKPEPKPEPEPITAEPAAKVVEPEPTEAASPAEVAEAPPVPAEQVEHKAEAAEPVPAEEPAGTPSEPQAEAEAVETSAGEAAEAPASEAAQAAEDQEEKGKRKKKKERKMQPAQIIGRVELKKEPEPEPEPPAAPPRPAPPAAEQPRGRRSFRPPAQEMAPPPPPIPEDDKRSRKKKEKKTREEPESAATEPGKVRRRKEVLLKGDLYDERPRGARGRSKAKKVKQKKTEITVPRASKRRIKLPEVVTVAGLAKKMSIKAAEVIRQLIGMGVTASINESIDFETASIVANEFGFEVGPMEDTEQEFLKSRQEDKEEDLEPRSPVVTFMGHVDHGKTSLLDYIRSTHVTDTEAGGITQHIGAYKVSLPKGDICFLDTPGHEAFTAMRARGAHITDFVVLVVAADDGVMDQTREAINHARAAEVPIIVAVNKMDKPESDKDRVIRELSEQGLIPEDWGGETLFGFVSAKTGDGVDDLLELILLQAEIMELKANPNKAASGTVLEARLDKGRGPVATVLVTEGTLKTGDPFVAGSHHGKTRAMLDHEGRSIDKAGPATPVEVQGFSGVPEAGEKFSVVEEERLAKQIGTQRHLKQRELEAAESATPASLDDLWARLQDQANKEFNVILKGDVQGSVEALKESLLGIESSEIKLKVIHTGVGTVTESDVMLAAASNAIIIGFNVRPEPRISQLAEDKHIDIRFYSVIYEAIEDVRNAMEGLLEPVEKEIVVGQAEVRQTFSVPKIGMIAGCFIRSGKIHRSNNVRLLRDNVVIYDGKITSMKRFKDDIREAVEGYECGIGLHNFNDIKVGDVIEAYAIEHESAKLA